MRRVTIACLAAVGLATVAVSARAECPEGYAPSDCERFAVELAELCDLAEAWDGREDVPIDQLVLTLMSWLSEPPTPLVTQVLAAVASLDPAGPRVALLRDGLAELGVVGFECPVLETLLSGASSRTAGFEAIALSRDACARAGVLDSARLWAELLVQEPGGECADEARARLSAAAEE